MNKKNNRKGFTIVELVIVIAVIAILATVLVPTFGDVIERANLTAAKQEAKNLFTEYVSKKAETGEYIDDMYVKTSDEYYVQIVDGAVVEANPTKVAPTVADTKVLSKANGALVYECVAPTTHTAGTTCDWCSTATPAAGGEGNP